MKKKSEKRERRTEMKKIAIFAVLAAMLLVSANEALAYWKPIKGATVYDPSSVFEETFEVR